LKKLGRLPRKPPLRELRRLTKRGNVQKSREADKQSARGGSPKRPLRKAQRKQKMPGRL
jgi:hypothetical protein